MTASKPDPIDVHVGDRVRLRRTMLGISQEYLGEHLGLTFQQIHKYERGANRINASRLYRIAQKLSVSVQFFFDDLPGTVREDIPTTLEQALLASGTPSVPTAHPETMRLVRAFYRIDSKKVRAAVLGLIRNIASQADHETDDSR